MRFKVLKEEIVWTFFIVVIVGAIVVYFPSKEYWGERLWDKLTNPGKPLEGNLITIGKPPIFSVQVPDFKEWEIADISGAHVVIRREDDKAPVRIEITTEIETDIPQPKTLREFKAYALGVQGQYSALGYGVIKNKNIYIEDQRWALLEMSGWSDDMKTHLYIYRSPTRLYKIKVDFPTGEGFDSRESNQYGRAVAYSVKVIESDGEDE